MGGTRDRCADAIDVYAPDRRCEGRTCVVLWTRCGWWMGAAIEVRVKVMVKMKMKVDTRRYGIRDPDNLRGTMRNLRPRAPRLREILFGPEGDGALFRRHLLSARFVIHVAMLRWNIYANTV